MKKDVVVIYPMGNLETVTKRLDVSVEVHQHATPSQILEVIFRAMNRVDGSEIEHHLDKYKVRSMCVGDMVELDGNTYLCSTVGWQYMLSGMGFVKLK